MSNYKGFPNWAQWNVSLWINNDEELYRTALNCAKRYPRDRACAVRHFMGWLKDSGITATPDGAAYSMTAVRGAMKGMK